MKLRFGNSPRCRLSGLLLLVCLSWQVGAEDKVPVPPQLPAADFARLPDVSAAQLSPDGKFLAYLYGHEGMSEVAFLDIEKDRARYYNPGFGSVYGFTWVSNERAIVRGDGGLGSIRRTAKGWVALTGLYRFSQLKGTQELLFAHEVLHADGRDPAHVLILDRNTYFGEQMLYPDVIEMDAETGAYHQLLKNPGHVTRWGADWDGHVRFGFLWENRVARLLHRETEEAPWRPVGGGGREGAEHVLLGMNRTGEVLHIGRANPAGFWTIYPFDIAKGTVGEPIFEHERYDIVPEGFGPMFAGVPLTAPIYSRRYRELVGVRYVTEGPRQYWFDPGMARLQEQIDRAFPGLVNQIVSFSHDENQMLLLSWSDREPGIYTLVDLAAERQLKRIGRRMPWIKPEQMAPTFPIELSARDGLRLNGYCTFPLGRGRTNLPGVMLVHGGPWVRDAWGFDPMVQFLANRGYAVLQVDYRGSSGYGVEFANKGRVQIGGAIQDDIADAVRWAIKQGILDPRRIAIMGGSYGGYSVLHALAKTPELYRCGVSVAGITDWPAIIKAAEAPERKLTYAYWEKRLGRLDDPALIQRLAAMSPVNFAAEIRLPLFLAHGTEDSIVPQSQTKEFARLLKKTGRAPEVLYFDHLGHGFPSHKQGEKFLNKLETFLARHLGTP